MRSSGAALLKYRQVEGLGRAAALGHPHVEGLGGAARKKNLSSDLAKFDITLDTTILLANELKIHVAQWIATGERVHFSKWDYNCICFYALGFKRTPRRMERFTLSSYID